jgi:phenylacetic acid degradation operon negative regulatory protein
MSLHSAGSAVLIVFGELAPAAAVSTATLVDALTTVGHEPHAARQALVRGRRAGWLEVDHGARTARWSLSEEGRRVVDDGIRRVEALATESTEWDRRWLVLLVSVPQPLRSVRPRLYRALCWAGFGSPAPGVWVSPRPDHEAAAGRAVDRLGLGATTMSFVGSAAGVGLSDEEIVERAWSLDEVDRRYGALVADFAARSPADGPAALRDLLALDQELQALPAVDPQLPASLTGPRSARESAAELLAVRQAWRSPALAYWRALDHADGT